MLPNLITYARFAMLPVFVWLMISQAYPAALVVLILIGLSDWLDGFLARRLDLVTALGTKLDPIADRVGLIVIATSFVLAPLTPWWVLPILLVPDVVVAMIALRHFSSTPEMSVSRTGKVRTALLLLGYPTILLGSTMLFDTTHLTGLGFVILLAGLLGHVIASTQYASRMLRHDADESHRADRASG